MARALRLASTTFADMTSEPAVFIQGTSLLLDDVGGESPDVTLETLRTLLRMIEEKTPAGAAARRLHRAATA